MRKNMLVRRALPVILLLSLVLSLVGYFLMPIPVIKASNTAISISVGAPKINIPIKVSPKKQPQDKQLIKTLQTQGINPEYTELVEDYNISHPYSRIYRDNITGKFIMETQGLPMVDQEGRKIVSGFIGYADNYTTDINTFIASVSKIDQAVTLTDKNNGGYVTFNPVITLNGKELSRGNVTIYETDPENANYHNNVIDINYGRGVCVRRYRVIEGHWLGSWIFNNDPNGTIRIVYNQVGTIRLQLGRFAINEDEELIDSAGFASLSQRFGYPVRVQDTFTSGVADCDIYAQDAHYADAQGATTGYAVESGYEYMLAQNYYTPTTNPIFYYVGRIFIPLDTSSLSGKTITGATLGINGLTPQATYQQEANAGHTDLRLYVGTQADTPTTADYDSFQTTLLSDDFTEWEYPLTCGGSGSYDTITLNAAGLAAINTTGLTKFCIRCTGDINVATPTGQNWAYIYTNEKGAGYCPQLIVTFTTGGQTTTTYSPSSNVTGYWVNPTYAFSSDNQYAYRNVSTNSTNNATANSGSGWTNPTNAYQNGGTAATQTSGSGNNTYGTYGFNIASGSIYKVRVRTDAYSTGGVAANETRIAANDITNTGTFITAPLFSKINDNSDVTFITGQNNAGGHATFTASTNFTIPAASTIVDVAIHYRHRSATSGTACNSGTVLKVGGTYYGISDTKGTYTDNGTSSEPAVESAIADRTYKWTRNPKTNLAWVVNDVNNGAGAANPLQEWGIGGSDFNPDVHFFQCDIYVDYTTSSTDDLIRVRVSGDGGTNWSSAQNSTLTASLASYYFDFTSATTWTANTVNNTNLKVAVDSVTVGDTSTISLDWIPVEVMSFVASNLTQSYNTYGISLSGTDTVTKVEVGTEGYATSSENLSIEVSSNAGASWSSNQTTPSFPATDNDSVTWYDFTSATSWDSVSLNNTNFQVRITYVDNGSHGQLNLDWLPVRVTYTSGAPSVNNTPSSINYGVLRFSRTYWSKTGNTTAPSFPLGDSDCKFLLTNDSTITENITVSVTGNFTGTGANWTIVSTAPATDEARLYAYASGAADNTSGVLLSGTPQSFVTNLASTSTKYWEIRLDSGSSFSDGYQKTNTVRITASSP